MPIDPKKIRWDEPAPAIKPEAVQWDEPAPVRNVYPGTNEEVREDPGLGQYLINRLKAGVITPVAGAFKNVADTLAPDLGTLSPSVQQLVDVVLPQRRAGQVIGREADIAQEVAADYRNVGAVARPASVMDALRNPADTLRYYGGIGAESAPTILGAIATRNPNLANIVASGGTVAQTYGDIRQDPRANIFDALRESTIAGITEGAGGRAAFESAFAPTSLGRKVITTSGLEALGESGSEAAQTANPALTGREDVPILAIIRAAIDAGIVGTATGAGEAILGSRGDVPPSNAIAPTPTVENTVWDTAPPVPSVGPTPVAAPAAPAPIVPPVAAMPTQPVVAEGAGTPMAAPAGEAPLAPDLDIDAILAALPPDVITQLGALTAPNVAAPVLPPAPVAQPAAIPQPEGERNVPPSEALPAAVAEQRVEPVPAAGVVAGRAASEAAQAQAEAGAQAREEGRQEGGQEDGAVTYTAADFLPGMGREVGWSQRGGELMRERREGDDSIENFAGRATGDVTGRTTWVAKPDPSGGESRLWRSRPDRSLNEGQAQTALEKAARGEKLRPIEQRFVDYATALAEEYAETANRESAAYRAELEQYSEADRVAQRQAARDEFGELADADADEALALDDLVHRAYAAGAQPEAILGATFDGTPAEQARNLWRMVAELESADATVPEATQRDRAVGAAPREEGRAARPQPSQPAAGLFGAPSSREVVDAEARRRDAERDGRTGSGRTDMTSGAGDLFAGRRPQQAPLESVQPSDVQRMQRLGEDGYIRAITGGMDPQDHAESFSFNPTPLPDGATQIKSSVATLPDGRQVDVYEVDGRDDGGALLLYAVADGEVVGTLGAGENDSELIVNPDYRRRGVGTALQTTLREREPFAPTGGLSPAGERLARQFYQRATGALEDVSARDRFADRRAEREAERATLPREESRARGEREATDRGVRAAVEKALGPLKSRVEFVADTAGLPDNLRRGVEARLAARGGRGKTAAVYDQGTGKVYMITDANQSPERAVFTAFHELAGHHGLRTLLGDKLDAALGIARQNPTVRSVADAIAAERNIDQGKHSGIMLATEEALAELAAAVRTGNYAEIESRYKTEVPEGVRASLKRAVDNFLKRLKAAIDDIFGRHVFTDEDVRALLEHAWQAANEGPTIADVTGGLSLESLDAVEDMTPAQTMREAAKLPDDATGQSIIAGGQVVPFLAAAKESGADLTAVAAALRNTDPAARARELVKAIDAILPSLREEAPAPKAEPKPAPRPSTGTRNEITDAERAAAGRDPILRDAVQTNEQTLAEAMRTLKEDPAAGPETVEKLIRSGPAGVSLADEAVLLVHKTDLRNRRDTAAQKLADPNASEEAKAVAKREWESLEAQIATLDEAAVASGREWGRLGQFRQRMLRDDFTFEALERKERARLERPLTPAESQTIRDMAQNIASLQRRADAAEAQLANAASVSTYDDLIKRMGDAMQGKKRPTLARLREAANESRAALAALESVPSRKGQSGATINPVAFYHLARIGAYHVANGAATFSDWVAKMRADIGDAVDTFREALPEIFRASKVQADKPLRAEATVAEVLAKVDRANITPKDVRRLVEAHVGEGLRGEAKVMAAVAEDLGIEADQVRQLFVQTNPRTPQTLTEAKQELRGLRRLVTLQAEIDRLEAGLPRDRMAQKVEVSGEVQAKKDELAALRKKLRADRSEMRAAQREAEQVPVDPEARYQVNRGKDIARRIETLQKRIAAGDFAATPRVPRALNAANDKAQFELAKAKQDFLRHQFEDNLRNRTPVQKLFGGVKDTLNLARAMMTSLDLSGVLRQGGFITYGHPVRAAKSLVPMLKAFASEGAEHKVKREIENRANAPLYRKYGLELTGIGSGPLSQIEEAYASRWLDRLPRALGGGLVRGSGRAYTTFLNKLRADSFDAMVASMAKGQTPTPEEGKAIANFINVATGRGKIGAKANAGEALNTIFFAPRLVASRFQLLAGQPLYGGSARTRGLIAQEYARFLAGVGVVTALAALALGDDEEPEDRLKLIGTDPRSANFGKIRFGNTYLDPLAGLAQASTLLARLTTGETVTQKGDVRPLRANYTLNDLQRALGADIDPHKLNKDGSLPFGSGSAADVIGRFLRTKLAPVPGAAVNTLSGENLIGEPVTPLQAAGELVTPMSIGNVREVMEEQGIEKGAAITLLGLLGMGVQYRKPKEEDEEEEK